ncbi:uncharacterized protein LOC119987928 isoform X6 [Tripterygium wilfordii]|uniref:uncharacterized protein LOC119987928 isoform X6 n=1 Tax=Tripterygium wilfordii TaxID=458696 RepID=UPI0018F7E895|nr:uncharacterized protein LOC119987928 isoform X6 [Tripterygium wilfordii]
MGRSFEVGKQKRFILLISDPAEFIEETQDTVSHVKKLGLWGLGGVSCCGLWVPLQRLVLELGWHLRLRHSMFYLEFFRSRCVPRLQSKGNVGCSHRRSGLLPIPPY